MTTKKTFCFELTLDNFSGGFPEKIYGKLFQCWLHPPTLKEFSFFPWPFPNHCKLNFIIEPLAIDELLDMKLSSAQLSPKISLGAPSTGGFPQCWGNYIFQSWGISPVLGKCVLQFSEISAFIPKKIWIKPNEWNIFIIFIIFCTQKKNYSFLALLLNCQKLERKKHISPALGKSPRIEKCHFPSTGEIPQCWEPPDCVIMCT